MGWRLLHSLLRLSLPGGFLLLALWLLIELWGSADALTQLARIWPPAVLAVALLLAWWFHQQRLMTAILVIALAERGLLYLRGVELAGSGRVLADLLALLLGLNLMWICLLRARGRPTWRSAGGLVAVVLQALLFLLLVSPAASHARSFLLAEAERLPLERAWVVAAALFPALVVMLVAAVGAGGAGDRGLLWALVAVILAITGGEDPWRHNLYFSGAALILVLAILESSYQMAYEDELTGLPSRRAMNEALEDLGDRYAVALLDIDHFKQVNDRHGHEVGDQVLQAVAAQLSGVGGGGRCFRYGGEEFAILFAGRRLKEVLPHLEELRGTIAGSRFTLREAGRPRRPPKQPPKRRSGRARTIAVTVSIGAAQPSDRRPDPESVVKAADQALYRAKRGGRDQVRR